MMKAISRVMCVMVLFGIPVSGSASATEGTAHDFSFKSIDGGNLPLSEYAGKSVMVVNTTSFCGFTRQYRGLQDLWERYRETRYMPAPTVHAVALLGHQFSRDNRVVLQGAVYRALGLPDRMFTANFAMARVFGYIAHFVESRQDNRIVRPAAHYVGAPVPTPLSAIRASA